MSESWIVYIVECRDQSYYTGCTVNLEARIAAHNSGKGAKYTNSRRPVQVVYQEVYADRSAAQKREAAIKKLRRQEKQKLFQK
ncbi:GIY-YIG nuclease family protein [Patescibacteria group bacterium]|nr:GIY-YIG nuclease family protein [Patescibacteria group bacterium]